MNEETTIIADEGFEDFEAAFLGEDGNQTDDAAETTEEVTESYTKCSKCKTCYILISSKCNCQEAVYQCNAMIYSRHKQLADKLLPNC